jgi:hypothetical protein
MDENNKIIESKGKSLIPQKEFLSDTELKERAKIYFESGLAPSHLKNWQGVFIAMTWAQGIGIHVTLGLSDIYVIDNKASLMTEAAMAVVRFSGFCEYIKQEFIGKLEDGTLTAICKVKRKGEDEHISKFSIEDAKRALLWGKKTKSGYPTAWITNPPRMLMYRAIGFALRDVFGDALRGAKIREEIIDYAQYDIVDQKMNDKGQTEDVKIEIKSENKTNADKRRNVMKDLPPDEDTNFEEVK